MGLVTFYLNYYFLILYYSTDWNKQVVIKILYIHKSVIIQCCQYLFIV